MRYFWRRSDQYFEAEHRGLLLGLRFDRRGVPSHGDRAAGIDECYLPEARG